MLPGYLKILILTFLLTLAVLLPIIHGQPGLPGEPPNEAPVDGGLALLAALGAGYGLKKLRNRDH